MTLSSEDRLEARIDLTETQLRGLAPGDPFTIWRDPATEAGRAEAGGPDLADAFELYNLPLDATSLSDAEVAARLDEVWGFWQRQRDHPKYRTLVARLVDEHEQRSAPLRSATSRASALPRRARS